MHVCVCYDHIFSTHTPVQCSCFYMTTRMLLHNDNLINNSLVQFFSDKEVARIYATIKLLALVNYGKVSATEAGFNRESSFPHQEMWWGPIPIKHKDGFWTHGHGKRDIDCTQQATYSGQSHFGHEFTWGFFWTSYYAATYVLNIYIDIQHIVDS